VVCNCQKLIKIKNIISGSFKPPETFYQKKKFLCNFIFRYWRSVAAGNIFLRKKIFGEILFYLS